jgi:hypothetical protein
MQSFRLYFEEQELTLKYHDKLNPVFWENEKIDSEVREHLLKVAEFFRDFANIPKNAILDIILTGGNANYNYTKYSDLDVHLIIDKKKLKVCDPEIMDDYLRDKKALCTLTHDITVKGFPVELYAQGSEDATSGDQGVYSLKDDRWVKEPKKEKVSFNDPYLKKKIDDIESHIKKFIDNKSNDVEEMDKYKEKLRLMRGSAIQKGGEFSIENLAFKEIRNRGLLEKFSDYIRSVEDQELSLD